MNDMTGSDPFSESALRQALRLDPDERGPRLDAAALAVAAGRRTVHEQVLRGLRGLALVGIGAVAEGTVALAAFNILSALDLTWPLDIALGIVMAVARQLVVIGGVTASPAVGLATLAAVIFATIYERNGRESLRVRAS
ncbi:MAG TPA: hypothetical protein VGA38_12565 [Candidatus Limnocylindria bacterium]